MAHWDLLKTTWAGTTGTDEERLATINAMTVTGSIPTTFTITGDQLLNCLDWAEFATLSTTPIDYRSLILQVCATPGQLRGGQFSFIGGLFVAAYATKMGGPTIAALTALALGVVQPWTQVHGYPTPLTYGDIQTMMAQP